MDLHTEQLYVVDESDKVIGQESRDIIHKKGLLHREVHVWVYNDKNEILFQRRSPTKETHPNLLDASAGGHVDMEDTYESAAIHELEEETGIKATDADLRFIKKIRHKGFDKQTGKINNTFLKSYAYKIRDGDTLRLEEGKATKLEWWPLERIFNLTDEESEDFIPKIFSDKYLDVYKAIQRLIK